MDKEDLYTLKINCKGKRTVGKANKGVNVEKIIIGLKSLKKRKEKRRKKRKTPQNWERLKTGEEDERERDGWMASPTQRFFPER